MTTPCPHTMKIDEMYKMQKEMHVIITGNGKPEEGLVFQSRLNTNFRLACEKWVWIVIAAVTVSGLGGIWWAITIYAKG